MFDLLLIVVAVAAAVGGFRLGFLARVASWLGLAAGVAIGAAVLPTLFRRLAGASDLTLALVAIGTLVGGAFVGQAIGLVVGSRLHIALPQGPVRQTDRVAGAVSGVVGVLVALWLLLPTLADVPGWVADQSRRSVVAREVSQRFPDAPDALQALRRVVGEDPFPEVFDGLRPAPDAGSPPAASGISPAVADAVVGSTVKVEGEACDRVQDGSGFVVAPGLVVTNAHVVAGEDATEVELSDGTRLAAEAVAFDPGRDLAVLRVEGLDRRPLPLRDGAVGDTGGVFGYPGGGSLEVSPFAVNNEITAVGTDIYDATRTRREVLVLAADLAPGDSGSALVNPRGEVIGVAFAVAPDSSNVAYALTVDELRDVLAGDLATVDDTGGCLV